MNASSIAESGFDALPMQTVVVDPAGVIVRTNAAWRTDDREGTDAPPDPVGTNYLRVCREGTDSTDVVSTDGADGRPHATDGGTLAEHDGSSTVDGPTVADGIEAVLAGDRGTFDHEYACHSADERRWFLMRATGFDHGGETFAEIVHLDITERKLAEERVDSRSDRLETLAGILGHDLRNPLQVIQGRVELLDSRLDEDGAGGVDRRTDDLASIGSSADRIEAIIEDALQLVRGGSPADERTTTVHLREAAESAWGHVRSEEASLRVDGSFAFDARPGRLGQVFENLFANAVEHVGPEVAVVVGPLDDPAGGTPRGFYVADDGPGVPPAEHGAVFDPGHTSDVDGTGLGLAIVEQFAEAEGWHVSLVEATDGGARFEVRGVGAD